MKKNGQKPKKETGVKGSAEKLSEKLVRRIIDKKELVVKSIDEDYGLRIDAYNAIKDKLGFVRSTLFIDSRFCVKYKEKTGIDLMIISPETVISSIESEVIDSDKFIDIYKNLENGEFYHGESKIDDTKHKYMLRPLRDDEKLMNAGIALLLSKADSMKSVRNMEKAAFLIILIILIIVIVFHFR